MHGKHGYIVFLVASIINIVDVSSILRRIFNFFRSSNEKFAFKSFWTNVILGRDEQDLHLGGDSAEYTGLVSAEPKDIVLTPLTTSPVKQVHYDLEDEEEGEQISNWTNEEHAQTNNWANGVNRHRRNFSHTSDITLVRSRSTHSDDTLQEDSLDKAIGLNEPILRRIGNGVFHTVEYSLVIAGLMQVLTGIVVYTGGCRENYINGCLAHLISKQLSDAVSVSKQLLTRSIHRGRDFLVLWSSDFCSFSRRILLYGMGMESGTSEELSHR